MADPFDEDADLRAHLATFGPDAVDELRRVLRLLPITAPRSCTRSPLDRPTRTSPR